MTETEKKALALLNEVAKEMGLEKVSSLELDMPGERALLRAIEQHEAFRQEVSDAVKGAPLNVVAKERLNRFIIPPRDLLAEAVTDCDNAKWVTKDEYIACLRAALASRGLEIREVGHD